MNPTQAASRIFCALDTADATAATAPADKLKDAVGGVKPGNEFFTAAGPAGGLAVRLARLPIFLDLKFHDIPNTVAGAVCSSRGVAALRALSEFKLVVPGIRRAWAAAGDHKRLTTAAEAIGRGADMLVIGRPITKADYPVDAARRMAQGIAPEGAETTGESD